MQPQTYGREVVSAQKASPADVLERIIIHGDLSKLDQEQRVDYYRLMCSSLGLNPNTRPFAYLQLQGKTVLYALRDCTDQLRKIHGISVVETRQEEIEGVYIVVAKVRDRDGREDEARGAVSIANLKGEALANAIMKTETKAKRRATLSIAGLGVLDETEIEDVKAEPKRKSSAAAKRDGTNEVLGEIRRHIQGSSDLEFLSTLADSYAQELADMPVRWSLIASQEFEDKWRDLGGDPTECPVVAPQEPG
ncbi:MAG: hypothetical protein WC807_18600 [Hyphomicrobium sp.]|jgi:hypothetical protein